MKIGYFESDANLRYQDEVQGDLITQVNSTIEVLTTKYLRAWVTYQGLQRIETWPMPMAALREAVLNAVAHKDYGSGIPIQISVYPDKLMIWNPGELPPDWTLEKLLGKHASIPFNPDVANVFFRAGMIEAWGRGIERIMEACRKAGTPEPEVQCEPSGLWVAFHFLPEHQVSPETSVKTSAKTSAKTSVSLCGSAPLRDWENRQDATGSACILQASGSGFRVMRLCRTGLQSPQDAGAPSGFPALPIRLRETLGHALGSPRWGDVSMDRAR